MEQDKIAKIIADFEIVKQKYQAKLQKSYKSLMKEFWKKNKKIKAVVWLEFTDYFNDGEPCYFSVHEMVPLTSSAIKEFSIDIYPYNREEFAPFQTDWNDPKRSKVKQAWEKSVITLDEWESACKDLDMIAKLPSEVFEDMFGDHVRVTVTRTSVNVDEYTHHD